MSTDEALNVVSFILSYLNYEENLTQTDKQEIMVEVDRTTETTLREIHDHLQKQDDLLQQIWEKINEIH